LTDHIGEKAKTKRELILELREAHPDWSHRQVAEAAGSTRASVISVVKNATPEGAKAHRLIAKRAAERARSTPEGIERARLARNKWRTENPDKDRSSSRRWRDNNRDEWNAYFRRRNSTREGRIHLAVRNATRRIAGTGGARPDRSLGLLGCTLTEARLHIEQQFRPGMTWDNHGEWHIDHVRPLASFDLSDPEQVRACAHYTNLQPLWAVENLAKGARV